MQRVRVYSILPRSQNVFFCELRKRIKGVCSGGSKEAGMSKRSAGRIPRISRRTVTVIGIALALVAVLAVLYVVGRRIEASSYENSVERGDLAERFSQEPSIWYQGEPYVPKKGIQTFLLLGIDKTDEVESVARLSKDFRNGGQADFLLLMIVDAQGKTVSQWQIDRDTMAEITTLGVLGTVSGTRTAQICLSHSFGDGEAWSCELTAEAVQRLLYGIPIDFYMAISYDAVATLNDAVGGVTVTIEDDFTAQDPAMAPGTTLTLTGQQAELFVRSRMSIGDGQNTSRMRRQRAYMAELSRTIDDMVAGNTSAAGSLFDTLGDALVTNLKRGRMVNEVNKAAKYQRLPVQTLEGEHTVSEAGFVEFHVDEEALQRLVVETFYQKAQ